MGKTNDEFFDEGDLVLVMRQRRHLQWEHVDYSVDVSIEPYSKDLEEDRKNGRVFRMSDAMKAMYQKMSIDNCIKRRDEICGEDDL